MSARRLSRAGTIAASAFIVWHTLAMLVGPLPSESMIARKLQPVFYPYLTLFSLGHNWDFYSPNIGTGHQLRYSLEAGDGTVRIFSPIEEISWWHPAYWWFKAWHTLIISNPDQYGDAFAATVCEEHADLKPIAITLLGVQQGEFVPADFLDGQGPMSPDYVDVNELKRIECPQS